MAEASGGNGSLHTECLPLSSPALNGTIDFMLSGILIGCQPLRFGCDFTEYLHNIKPADSPDNKITFHYTGSRAEGIDRASDDDYMFVNHNFRVVDQSTNTVEKEKETSCFTAVHVRPGYVHLHSCESFNEASDELKLQQNDGFLRSDVVKAFMMNSDSDGNESDHFFDELAEHGPALTDEKHDTDFVCALPSYEWPEIAMEFCNRVREFNQPSREIIDQITSKGCLYVGVGHPNSADRGKEWRLSFSLAEKILVRSWNDVKVKCYTAVKTLCKENFNSQPKVLCSYFIKTAIFWLSERMPESFWEKERILSCISAIIEELLSYTSGGRCPNYFLPSNNMMDNLSYEQRKDVISKIESTMKDIPLAILQSKLGDDTFKSSADFVTLYLILKNSDSPSNAEMHLADVNSHNKTHFENAENYYESMHLSQTLQELKHFFYQRLYSGKIDYFAQMISEDLPRVIANPGFKTAYEKLLFLALGDIYQQMASSKCDQGTEECQELLTQAENWISKAGNLKHPSGFDDGGVLTNACKSLFYYTTGDKDCALDLCTQESERVYSDPDSLSNLCLWSCAVVISANEAEKFRTTEPNFAAAFDLKDLFVSPMSIILFIAIKCSRNKEQLHGFSKQFENLQQWLPPQITDYEKELHANHMLLKSILSQEGILQVTE